MKEDGKEGNIKRNKRGTIFFAASLNAYNIFRQMIAVAFIRPDRRFQHKPVRERRQGKEA
jgi:hypothetical protein